MIYNKEVAFPYPVLMDGVNNYKDEQFEFDIDVKENTESYNFEYSFEIGSSYIKKFIRENKAQPILIIQSKDNKFFKLNNLNEENGEYRGTQRVSKRRVSLNSKSKLQIIIQSSVALNYGDNDELLEFYDDIKTEINIAPNSAIAISNEVVFDGNSKNPTELFEKKLDENLKSEIAIELTEDVIVIKYKKADYQFQTVNGSKALNYPYIYMGLQKALNKFILETNKEKEVDFEDGIDISELISSDFSGINYKLLSLMKNKGIVEINSENIDEVIYKISDNIIEKYFLAIKRLDNKDE